MFAILIQQHPTLRLAKLEPPPSARYSNIPSSSYSFNIATLTKLSERTSKSKAARYKNLRSYLYLHNTGQRTNMIHGICTRRKISVSLGYVTERGEGKKAIKDKGLQERSEFYCLVVCCLPLPRLVDHPTFVQERSTKLGNNRI